MTNRNREGYKVLEHVTDALIEAWGPTFERALAQAGVGFYDTMIYASQVRPDRTRGMAVSGHDELELVYNWLEQLLVTFEVEGMVFRDFEIRPVQTRNSSLHLQATVHGEDYDPTRHGSKVGVKGVTYHDMAVERSKERVLVRFLLDL